MKKLDPYVLSEYQLNKDQFPIKNIILNRENNIWYEPILHKIRSWLAGRIQREIIFKKYYIKSLKAIKPDIVHIHFGVPGLLLSRIVRELNIPFITSFYGTDLSKIPFLLGRNVYERNGLFENGQIFTAEGSAAKSALINLGCPKEKAKLLRIGIDFKKYKFKLREKNEKEPLKILFCGRFIEKKGLQIAIHSIANAIKMGCHINFNIIGDGPQKDEAKRLVDKLKIIQFVKFFGIMKHKEFINECHGHHALIVPSQIDKENGETEGGAPTVLIEAQATGLPIIATDHADIPEIVIDGKSGFLAKEGDSKSLSKAIIKLYKNPLLLKTMGQFGKNHVFRQHNIVDVSKRLLDLYKLAIESKPS